MKKSQQVCFYVFAVLFALSFAAGIAEAFGVSVCFFGTPLHQYLAVPICLFAVLFCLFACKRIGAFGEKDGNALLSKLLCAALIALCAVTVCITAVAAALTETQYVGQALSGDKAYKVFYETETADAEPIAHLYRRHSPFLMTYCNSAVLYGYAGEIAEIETAWGETYCTISYAGYSEDAQSADDIQTLSRKLYYEPSQG